MSIDAAPGEVLSCCSHFLLALTRLYDAPDVENVSFSGSRSAPGRSRNSPELCLLFCVANDSIAGAVCSRIGAMATL